MISLAVGDAVLRDFVDGAREREGRRESDLLLLLLPRLGGLRPLDLQLDRMPVGCVLQFETAEGGVAQASSGGDDPLRSGSRKVDLLAPDVGAANEDVERRFAGNRLDLSRNRLRRGQKAEYQPRRYNNAETSFPEDISTPSMISREQYLALRKGAALVDRSDRGRIRLTGKDRRDYLQGLLTNDIAALTPGTGCYACLLTAQGRMISDMYVVETGDAVLMDLERQVTPRVVAHLDQFVFSEDVVVSDVSDSIRQLGVFGPKSPEVLRQLELFSEAFDFDRLNVLDNRTSPWRETGEVVTVVRRDDLGETGFDLWISTAQGDALALAIVDAGATRVESDAAEICRVETGRPVFGKDMTEDTIPLEAGIEDRAISRTKGCYVGQEVIIRVLDRGHGRVARRLVGLDVRRRVRCPCDRRIDCRRRSRRSDRSRARSGRHRWNARLRSATCTAISFSLAPP